LCCFPLVPQRPARLRNFFDFCEARK
jgi:hypothetical protein